MTDLAIALNRFGIGARGDEPPLEEPRRWLAAQFDRFEPRPAPIAAAPTRAAVAGELADFYEEQRGQRRANGGPRRANVIPMAEPMPAPDARPMAMQGEAGENENPNLAGLPDNVRRYVRRSARDHYLNMVAARTTAALTTPAPFVERMVHFWANHFAVSADRLVTIGMAGLLEFDAIRPNVLGRFSDMLLAVEQHPAMLLYLDQAQSIGPNSLIGARIAARTQRPRGLNENLAREILELHTVGVHGGYTQADVTEFARALTGWSVGGIARGPAQRLFGNAPPGDFRFANALHEPGARTILGHSYGQEGEAQARAVLSDLAAHPATARHLATKLARHFAGDEPPPAMVARLERTWLRSGGDLPAVYREIIASPEAWAEAPAKFRTPWEWSLASLRAVGAREAEPQPTAGLLNQLGQPVWRPGSPAGFDDIAPSWAGPDALMRRVEAAERIAGRTGGRIDARQLGPRLLPGALSPVTTQAIARAESPVQGLALLLVAPEFLRR